MFKRALNTPLAIAIKSSIKYVNIQVVPRFNFRGKNSTHSAAYVFSYYLENLQQIINQLLIRNMNVLYKTFYQ